MDTMTYEQAQEIAGLYSGLISDYKKATEQATQLVRDAAKLVEEGRQLFDKVSSFLSEIELLFRTLWASLKVAWKWFLSLFC